MLGEEQKVLSVARMEHAQECLVAAKNLLVAGNCKSATNRAYYAVFHAMRAVLAFDGIDMKHHSGVILEFRKQYIKTGIFETELSQIISILFDLRTDSDYDDFFIVTKEEVAEQIKNAELFLDAIGSFLAKE